MTSDHRLQAGVLTLSDSRSENEDESGKALMQRLDALNYDVPKYAVIPDDRRRIEETLTTWANAGIDLLLTTGGTGPGPRDITPEATAAVIDKLSPGFSELIRLEGSKKTKRAYLSRGISGIKGKTIIINLPGSKKGALESFEAICDLIPHTVKMMEGGGH